MNQKKAKLFGAETASYLKEAHVFRF